MVNLIDSVKDNFKNSADTFKAMKEWAGDFVKEWTEALKTAWNEIKEAAKKEHWTTPTFSEKNEESIKTWDFYKIEEPDAELNTAPYEKNSGVVDNVPDVVEDTPAVEQAPAVKETPVEDIPVADTPLETMKVWWEKIEEAKNELEVETPEELKARWLAVLDEFNNALDKWADQEYMINFARRNQEFMPELRNAMKVHFWEMANLDFFNKYSNYTDSQLYTAEKNWDFVTWDNKYNLLSPEQKASYEDYKALQTASTITDETEFNSEDWSFTSYYDRIAGFFDTSIRSNIEAKLNAPEYLQVQKDLESKQNEINEVDDALKVLEDDIMATHKWVPAWVLAWIVADKQQTLINKKNTLINEYNSKLGLYSNMKSDIELEMQLSTIEDENKKFIYQTALDMYTADKEQMTELAMLEFEEQATIRAEERKLYNDAKFLEYKTEIENWIWEFKTINDMLYIVNKDWTNARLVIDWTEINSSNWKYVTSQIFSNDDWTYTTIFTDKLTKQVWSRITWVNWELVWDYIENLWTWVITGYWWEYDWWLWLDVDWVMGQGFFAPMWWVVEYVWNKWDYWNIIQVTLDDWNTIQYSHIDSAYLKEWDKFGANDVLWAIWNTWYVLDINWNVPTAEQLANWVWSHLDIISLDPTSMARSAEETEAYLRWLTENKPLTEVQFSQQNTIIKDFKSKALISDFEEWLWASKNLIASLTRADWAWDMAWIFQFMKSLDPNSTVRESEFQQAWNTAGLTQAMITKFMWYKEWDKLNTETRKAFIELAIEYMKIRATAYDRAYNDSLRLYKQQWLPLSSFPARASDLIWNLWNETIYVGWGEFNLSEMEQAYENSKNTTANSYNN